MRVEGIFLTEAGAKSIPVGLRELSELLLGGHLHGSRAGGAGVERLAHESAGRAEGKSEGDGGELHGLKENLRGAMVGLSVGKWSPDEQKCGMYVSECVGVLRQRWRWAVGWRAQGHSIEHRKAQEKDRAYGQIRLN